MTKFGVCHAQGHKRLFFVAKSCRIIEWNARNSGRNICRSACTSSELISLGKRKLTLKTHEISPMFIWSRFITIIYGSNR